MPAKPIKERDTSDAAIRVIGRPFKNSGISLFSILPLIPENIIIATIKPMPAPTDENMDSRKL